MDIWYNTFGLVIVESITGAKKGGGMLMKRSAIAEHLIAFLLAAVMLCASFPGVRAEGAMA